MQTSFAETSKSTFHDEADRYWQDDHHRFSYTENMALLLKVISIFHVRM